MPVLADVLTSANAWNSEQPLLTYLIPAELQAELYAGQLVAVPYGVRLVEGIVWHVWEGNERDLPKQIVEAFAAFQSEAKAGKRQRKKRG